MDNQLSLVEVMDQAQERFNVVAPAMNFDKEKGFAVQLLNNNSRLMDAAKSSPNSLLQAVTNIAAINLSLNPAEKLAYLLPRNVKNNEGKWVPRIFLEPSYMGLCKLATDSGSIKWVQSQIVFKNDTFTDNGPGEKPTHIYDAFSSDRGDFVGVYCVAKTSEGDYLTTTMKADEIEDIKGRSEAGKKGFGPWITDFFEQAKKTVVRRGFKMWPRSNGGAMDAAVHMSNENEGFEPIMQSAPKIAEFTADQKNYFDQVIEKNDALEMFVFVKSIEEEIFINLYHSFSKDKGKYQKVVNSLNERGASKFMEYKDALIQSIEEGDTGGSQELIEELSKDVLAMLSDESEIINDFLKG